MSNPILNENFANLNGQVIDGEPCSIKGTINKSFLLLVVLLASFAVTFKMCATQNTSIAGVLTLLGCIGSFILALIISFKPTTSPVLAPIYAFGEGLVLGTISYMFNYQYPGIILQAVLTTFCVLGAMLFLYQSRIITVTNKLRSVVIASTIAVAIVYLLGFILTLFHVNVSYLYDSNPVSIGISVVICLIAASNLLLDFDIIERASQNYLPKFYEWYGAFGLMVTLVWLYIEVLKLFAKLNNRR